MAQHRVGTPQNSPDDALRGMKNTDGDMDPQYLPPQASIGGQGQGWDPGFEPRPFAFGSVQENPRDSRIDSNLGPFVFLLLIFKLEFPVVMGIRQNINEQCF